MGNSQGTPQELASFKKLPEGVLVDVNIPEIEENRSPTNLLWLIAFIVCFVIMLPFVIYTLIHADHRRWYGTDSCGNICGSKNDLYDGIDCSGKDMTDLPYLNNEICVSDCGPEKGPEYGICIKNCSYEYDRKTDLIVCRAPVFSDSATQYGIEWLMVVAAVFCILLSLAFLFLLRYATGMLVWGIMITCFLMLGAIIGIGWYRYVTIRHWKHRRTMFVTVSSLTIFGVIYLFMLVWLRRKINLVIKLLKEATKAIFCMPELTWIPILAVFAQFIVAVCFVGLFYFMLSAGTLKRDTAHHRTSLDRYSYQYNSVMMFTFAYALFMWFWLSQVVVGVHYMTVSGAVSKWYFSRNKSDLNYPMLTSARITFKFHLGTAVLGGFIIAMVNVVKCIVLALFSNSKVKRLMVQCVDALEEFFKFLSKNAYIITAMHGQPFLKSGRRAARLIFYNLKDVIAINWIGDFVLGFVQVLIILITYLFFWLLLCIYPGNPLLTELHVAVGIVVSVLLVGVTFGAFETTIDTIFMCYCEDSLMNDGMARPYFMSRDLMEFVEGSKKAYGKNIAQV